MDASDNRPGSFRRVVLLELTVLAGLGVFWGLRKTGLLQFVRQVGLRGDAAVVRAEGSGSGEAPARRVRREGAGVTPQGDRVADSPSAEPRVGRARPLPALRKPVLLVDKSRKLLAVFDGQRLVKTYPVAVGAGRGDKRREGDRCTPEGEFYVCVKNPQSRYVLSLGLSYPRPADAERGLRAGQISTEQYDRILWAHRNGRQPPWNTPLGGEIMIHGRRDGGRQTLGCIALEDADIRELYPAIPRGTRVIIRP